MSVEQVETDNVDKIDNVEQAVEEEPAVSEEPSSQPATEKPKKVPLLKNKKFYNFVFVPLMLLLAAGIRMFSVEIFIIPHNFAQGGVTGIATMIEYATGGAFSTGWTILIINVPLVILAFIFLSKGFAIKTGIATVLSSVGMVIMNKYVTELPEMFYIDEAHSILAAVASGALTGISFAILIKIGASSGGTDIVGMFIQKRFKATNVVWFITAIDAAIILVSYFVYGNSLTPVLMSLTEKMVASIVGDTITSGFKSALKYEIITSQPEEVSKEIIEKLGRGVTMLHATGMYSHNERALLICVIRRSQLAAFNRIMQSYPDTFAYLSKTSEVMGLGFNR